jgi:NADH dehydrogenase FAD-containing subunit
VRILEGPRAREIASGRVLLDDGDELPADLALLALGVAPARFFAEAGLAVGEDGGLLVDDTLRSLSFPEIFGGGDCISLQNHDLPRVGVYAVRQGPVLRRNLLAVLEDEAPIQFVPQQQYLQILNLGDGRGLSRRGGLVVVGRWPFLLKDWIDRRFMARFQVAGEESEPTAGD